jgi:uncharacterized membrane protein YheB (UPF0754 family)
VIEVLKEMRSLFNESNSWEVTQERDNALYQALLALEKLGRLEKWLNKKYDENWFVLTNNKDLEEARIIRNFIREVRGVLEE